MQFFVDLVYEADGTGSPRDIDHVNIVFLCSSGFIKTSVSKILCIEFIIFYFIVIS